VELQIAPLKPDRLLMKNKNEIQRIRDLLSLVNKRRAEIKRVRRKGTAISFAKLVRAHYATYDYCKSVHPEENLKEIGKFSDNDVGTLMDLVGDWKKQTKFSFKNDLPEKVEWWSGKQVDKRAIGAKVRKDGFSSYRTDSEGIECWRSFSRAMLFAAPFPDVLKACITLRENKQDMFPGEILFTPYTRPHFSNELQPTNENIYRLPIDTLLSMVDQYILGEIAFWGMMTPNQLKRTSHLFEGICESLTRKYGIVYLPDQVSKELYKNTNRARSDKQNIQRSNNTYLSEGNESNHLNILQDIRNEISSDLYESRPGMQIEIDYNETKELQILDLPQEVLTELATDKICTNLLGHHFAFSGEVDPTEWLLRGLLNYRNVSRSKIKKTS